MKQDSAQPLPAADFALSRDSFGQLVLTNAEEERFTGVVPIRLFPFSDRDHWISLVGPDNKELTLIEDLATLPANTRQLIEEELADREFLPIIERIMHVTSDVEPAEWHVQTDRGPVQFVLKSEDDIRTLSPGQLLIIDATGQRYIVRDYRKLDSYSRRVLEEYA
jgi:hypothetical protein